MTEQHFHLCQSESVADAHPWPKTERHIRARIGDRLVVFVESIRVEFQWILIVLWIMVDRTEGNPDVHPCLDGEWFVAGSRRRQFEIFDAQPVHERDNWIKS